MKVRFDQHAKQFGALGNIVRLKIVRFLVPRGAEGASAGEIQVHVDLAASTLSHHLKRLLDAGLLTTRPDGTFHLYCANFEELTKLSSFLWEDCCQQSAMLVQVKKSKEVAIKSDHRTEGKKSKSCC